MKKSNSLQCANPDNTAQGNQCAISHQRDYRQGGKWRICQRVRRHRRQKPGCAASHSGEFSSGFLPPTSSTVNSTPPVSPPSSHSLPKEASSIWSFQITVSMTVHPHQSFRCPQSFLFGTASREKTHLQQEIKDVVMRFDHKMYPKCNQAGVLDRELQQHRPGESAPMRLVLNFKAAGWSGRDVGFDREMRCIGAPLIEPSMPFLICPLVHLLCGNNQGGAAGGEGPALRACLEICIQFEKR